MRVLLHDVGGESGSTRFDLAARGLVMRGHEADRTGAAHRHSHGGADVVLGSGHRVAATAWTGWLAGARAMVLGVSAAEPGAWGPVARWCWESLGSLALVDPAGMDAIVASGLDPSHAIPWSSEPPPGAPDPTHPDTEILERACEQLVSRRRGAAAHGAIFLDRDGTLVVERHYLSRAEDVEVLPGVPQALRVLTASGYPLVVISNQSGVGRGLYSLASVYEAMAALRHALRRDGVELDAIYFCPHRPDEGCACRKPGIGQFQQAASGLNLALNRSTVIGDKRIDVDAGHAARARGILVRTGHGAEEERMLAEHSGRPPEFIADDLASAAAWVIEHAPEPPPP